ncbi:DMT family transporter [Clostridiaceae bacterium M8S5]|nr:DMT family transporter [Clostridiaceae bacterium M8S5]
MRFLAQIVNHLDRYSVISDLGISIICYSIMIFAFIYVVHLFWKKELYSRSMAIGGVVLRLVFFISLGYGFLHRIKVSSNVDRVIGGIWNNLFFGYMIVFGIYYILTIRKTKYRGYFYSFDVLVMTTPMIYRIFYLIYVLIKMFDEFIDGWMYVLIEITSIAGIGVIIYFFFKMFWSKNKYNILWFYMLGTIGLLTGLWRQSFIKIYANRDPLLTTSLFILLLGSYELVYYLIHLKKIENHKVTQSLLVGVMVLSVIMLNPVYNLFDLSIEHTLPIMESTVREDAHLDNPKVCEIILRKALNDYEGDFRVDGNSGIGVLYYQLSGNVGDYDFRFCQTNNRIFSIHHRSMYSSDNNLLESAKHTKSIEDIKDISLEFLRDIGHPYNPLVEDMIIEKEENCYKIDFPLKLSNGEVLKKDTIYDGRNMVYSFDGKLRTYNSNFGLYPLSFYDDITITHDEIENILKEFYRVLKKEMPPYAITAIRNEYDEEPSIKIQTMTEVIRINGKEKIVTSYGLNNRERIQANEKDMEIALKYIKPILKSEKYTYEVKENHYFKNHKHNIYVNLDNNGDLVSFHSYKNRFKDKTFSEFKINKNNAVRAVKKLYKPLEVYKSRVSLGKFINGQDVKYDYIVEIMPYGKTERHVYRVDSDNKEVTSLYDFDGVNKDE